VRDPLQVARTASNPRSRISRQIFPHHSLSGQEPCKNSALVRIKAKRLERSASDHHERCLGKA
jgi:hypothetical protein